MPHWSASDDVALEKPAAEPPPLAPVERVAEIFERLFRWDERLTEELLGELRRCSTADLVKLFGPPWTHAISPAAPPSAPVDEQPAKPATT
jgi:hypothetical protein